MRLDFLLVCHLCWSRTAKFFSCCYFGLYLVITATTFAVLVTVFVLVYISVLVLVSTSVAV